MASLKTLSYLIAAALVFGSFFGPSAVAQNKKALASEIDQLLFGRPDCYQYSRERKYAEALASANKLIASKGDDVTAQMLKVYLLLRLKRPGEAVELATKILPRKVRTSDLFMLRGMAYLDLHEYARAEADLSQTIKLNPAREDAYTLRAQAYKALGKNDLASTDTHIYTCLDELNSAWEEFVPGDAPKSRGQENPGTNAILEFAAGQKAFNRRDFHTAIRYFTHAIQLKPNFTPAYMYRGAAYEPIESRDKAAADLTKVIDAPEPYIEIPIVPADPRLVRQYDKWLRIRLSKAEAYIRRARSYLGLQKYALALADSDEAAKLQPEDRYMVEFSGNVLAPMGRHAEAIKVFKRAEKLDPEYSGCGYKLVRCLRALNLHKEAIQRLSWLLRTSARDDVLYMERADSLSKLGYHQEAIADLNKVLSLTPESRNGYIRRAQEFEYVGEYHAAVNDLTKAIALDSSKAKVAWEARQRVLKKMSASKEASGKPPLSLPSRPPVKQ